MGSLNLQQLIAIATLFGRRARIESLAPKTFKAPRSGKRHFDQECERRAAQQALCARKGKKWWGPPKWQGSFEATFGGRKL
jgi:hypothetical protein